MTKKLIILTLTACVVAITAHAGISISKIKMGRISFSNNIVAPIAAKTFLPIGDSHITGTGSSNGFGFRKQIQDNAGIGYYRLVGPFTSPSSDAQYYINHAGIGGQTTAQILARLSSTLTSYMSGVLNSNSIVFIDGGTNDCAQGVSNATTVNNLHTMVTTVNSFNPAIDIYVTLPNPTSSSTLNTCLNTLNGLTKTDILALQGSIPQVHVVDLYARFIANASYASQWLSGIGGVSHPNDTGYAVEGNLVWSCIQSPLNQYCDGN